MEVTEIPFVAKVGIARTEGGGLTLPFNASIQNHLNTVHAGAQFVLAETASGEFLQTLFPELVDKVVPVLRESQIKFKKPASAAVFSFPTVSGDAVTKFKEQFEKKGRSSISVDVEIRDAEGITTCAGVFNWFIQSVVQAET